MLHRILEIEIFHWWFTFDPICHIVQHPSERVTELLLCFT